jgi:hypothetical protein
MVTWGQNTVHNIGTPAPTPGGSAFGGAAAPAPSTGFSFASPAPAAGGGGFGSTGGFGSPAPATGGFGAPAPAGGGLFGATPAPSPGGGLFGAAPAPASGGLFGGGGGFGSPAPAPSSGLFGAPAPAGGGLFGAPAPAGGGLFGAPAPAGGGLFGAPAPAGGGMYGAAPAQYGQQQQQQVQQQPVQAALQAHMDAVARQEQERVTQAMQKLTTAYNGQEMAASHKQSGHFCTVLYNPLTPAMRQQQWMHGMGVDGRVHPLAPEKPPQISSADWDLAVVRNPDGLQVMPAVLVGAEALQARLTSQQEQVGHVSAHCASIQASHDMMERRTVEAAQQLDRIHRRHAAQRARLLQVMLRVELARCLNHPLQPDEVVAMERLKELKDGVEHIYGAMGALADRTRTQLHRPAANVNMNMTGGAQQQLPDQKELMQVMKEHREGLSTLTMKLQRDMKDLKLVQQRVDSVHRVTSGPPIR